MKALSIKLTLTPILTIALLLGACVSIQQAMPDITAASSATLDNEGTLELRGSGFAPDSEVVLLFTSADGVESDIGYALEPAPMADADGNWITTWSYGRFVKKKLVTEGIYSLVATDVDFVPLATEQITFAK